MLEEGFWREESETKKAGSVGTEQWKSMNGKTGTEKKWAVIVEGRQIQPESCVIAEDHLQG